MTTVGKPVPRATREPQYIALRMLLDELNRLGIPVGEPRTRLMSLLRLYRNESVMAVIRDGVSNAEQVLIQRAIEADREAVSK